VLASTLLGMGPEKTVNIDAAVQVCVFLNFIAACISEYNRLTGELPV
jgi:hypothetical protein